MPDASPTRPPVKVQALDAKRFIRALHWNLYGNVHYNPAKCERYNVRPCHGCGKCHACPATN